MTTPNSTLARLLAGPAASGFGPKLTTMSVDKTCRPPSQRTAWPFGHPRGGLNPVPAARWVGPPEPLQANAPEKHFKPWGTKGVTKDCGSYTTASLNAMGYRVGGRLSNNMMLPKGHGAEVNGKAVLPREENIRILDTIDIELHAGRPVTVAVDYHSGGAPRGDGLSDHWFYITGRQFLPDRTVYYLGQDNAASWGQNLPLYVHEESLTLTKPGVQNSDNAIDMEYRVVNLVTVHR